MGRVAIVENKRIDSATFKGQHQQKGEWWTERSIRRSHDSSRLDEGSKPGATIVVASSPSGASQSNEKSFAQECLAWLSSPLLRQSRKADVL